MANQPLDKGRVVIIAEKYQSGNDMKNRYATVGRATKWPADQGQQGENIDLELDTMPIHTEPGPLKLYIFWDSQNQNQGQGGQQQQGGGFNQGGQPGGGFNQGGGQQQQGGNQGGFNQGGQSQGF
jgi:hypothetical protein